MLDSDLPCEVSGPLGMSVEVQICLHRIEMPAIMQAGGWRSETTVARYTARSAVAHFYEQEGSA